jgi:hypothetical protein
MSRIVYAAYHACGKYASSDGVGIYIRLGYFAIDIPYEG